MGFIVQRTWQAVFWIIEMKINNSSEFRKREIERERKEAGENENFIIISSTFRIA